MHMFITKFSEVPDISQLPRDATICEKDTCITLLNKLIRAQRSASTGTFGKFLRHPGRMGLFFMRQNHQKMRQ